MKKHTETLLLIVALFGVFSCKTKSHRDALRLNNKICQINDTLFCKQTQWSKLMAYAVSSGDYTKLKPARKQLDSFLDTSMVAVSNLKDVAGSENYRFAETELLNFDKKMLKDDFIPFEKFKINTPMTKISIYIQKIKEDRQTEQTFITKLKELQNAYQEKNGCKFVGK